MTVSTGTLVLRRGDPEEADALAEIWLAARARMTYIPPNPLFEPDAVRRFFREKLIRDADILVAEVAGLPMAFAALEGDFLMQLYCRPQVCGQGLGKALLDAAKAARPNGLKLFVLEPNDGAIQFYEREGFRTLVRTDGADTMEKVPDRLMAWTP